ncbi:hypothetical protein HBI56_026640 [Parastagonospora nodorum]|nr:hypothetical protein HBH51_124710 [Parastagonospora nodorum]KAH3990745.1 hypothetical protein HBH52_009550 [Parastagonospora nodorum]KAH4006397.1 hypothetical protein HBI10_019970 [Parastagonospora nodorum]KAH4015266.1 hypothetical protein HBI13_160680 [Parastagonospora nodorum]KAH4025465.1 hypothetical protein HBI09_153840 [Parastagonospora nodorum]
MDATLTPYEYTNLGPAEIRLLRPDTHNKSTAWILDTVSLESVALEFDALSYTWGSQLETYPIVCNGKSMRVHHNLYLALPFLAHRMGELTHRPIWVDAVCINQNDDDEKAVQIKLMGQLYRRAKRVWVWLGCAPAEVQSHISNAISLLPYIAEEATRRKASTYTSREEKVALPLRDLEPELWQAILHLLRNSWYSRVWIIQEVALASDIVFLCGADKIDAASLESAVENDRVSYWKISDINGNPVKPGHMGFDNSTVFHIRELAQGSRASLSLDSVSLLLRVTLLMTGEHACFLEQDRVYGMLGLIREEELASLAIDFHAYTSVPTLYTRFATYLLLNNDPNKTQFWWRVFNMAFSFHKLNGLPSWVPDFHHQGRMTKFVCVPARITMFGHNTAQYCASAQPTVVTAGSRVGELMIRGKFVDEIMITHAPCVRNLEKTGEEGEGARWIMTVAQWHETIAQKILEKYDHEDDGDEIETWRVSEKTYWKTLFADNFLDESNKPITMTMCRIFRGTMLHVAEACNWILESIRRKAAGIEEVPPEIGPRCSARVRMSSPYQPILAKLGRLGDRQLFNTKHGRFGFTIKGVQPGDILCVFNSASTPHVLRRMTDRDDGAYQVIGDAYVDGMMLVEVDAMGIKDQDILLV